MSEAPFDAIDADIILHSSPPHHPTVPNQEFRVHKQRLVAASPVFRDMFELLHTPAREDGTIPIINLPESNLVLDLFLRFIYPGMRPPIPNLTDLVAVIAAAVKYNTESVIFHLRRRLVSPEFLKANPFRVYAISIRFGFVEESDLASTAALSINLSTVSPSDDFGYITVNQYHRLISFHIARSKKAQEEIDRMGYPRDYQCAPGCGAWFSEFKTRAKAELAIIPTTEVISSFPFLYSVLEAAGFCKQKAHESAPRGPQQLLLSVQEVKDRIDDLPSTISAPEKSPLPLERIRDKLPHRWYY